MIKIRRVSFFGGDSVQQTAVAVASSHQVVVPERCDMDCLPTLWTAFTDHWTRLACTILLIGLLF